MTVVNVLISKSKKKNICILFCVAKIEVLELLLLFDNPANQLKVNFYLSWAYLTGSVQLPPP